MPLNTRSTRAWASHTLGTYRCRGTSQSRSQVATLRGSSMAGLAGLTSRHAPRAPSQGRSWRRHRRARFPFPSGWRRPVPPDCPCRGWRATARTQAGTAALPRSPSRASAPPRQPPGDGGTKRGCPSARTAATDRAASSARRAGLELPCQRRPDAESDWTVPRCAH